MRLRIFIADDHAAMRDGLRAILRRQRGMVVVGTAGTGSEAVVRVRALQPDIVLMDIAMPELDGIAATQQILTTCQATRVIMLSMHSIPESIGRALDAGARGYLMKESAGGEIIRAIRTVQTGHMYLSQKIDAARLAQYRAHGKERPGRPALAALSPREREVLRLVAQGRSSADVAKLLQLSPKTVETYRSRLMKKLDLDSLFDLVRFAVREQLISEADFL